MESSVGIVSLPLPSLFIHCPLMSTLYRDFQTAREGLDTVPARGSKPTTGGRQGLMREVSAQVPLTEPRRLSSAPPLAGARLLPEMGPVTGPQWFWLPFTVACQRALSTLPAVVPGSLLLPAANARSKSGVRPPNPQSDRNTNC